MKRAVATLAPRIANVRDNSEVADGPAIKEKHTRLDTRCNQTCKLAKREHDLDPAAVGARPAHSRSGPLVFLRKSCISNPRGFGVPGRTAAGQ